MATTTNATDKASTPRLSPPDRPGRRTTSAVFHQREAHLRLPPPFCFFAPETSKPTPDHIVTLVVTQSAATPHHCAQRCPNLNVVRQHTFGSPLPPLGVLTTDPEIVLALARATF